MSAKQAAVAPAAQPMTSAAFVATLQTLLDHPGNLPLFGIWEQAAHLSEDFNERVRLKQAVDIVGAVLRATQDWAKQYPQLFAEQPAAAQAPSVPQPLTRTQIMDIGLAAGYDGDNPDVKAHFINGIRHAERAHGIT